MEDEKHNSLEKNTKQCKKKNKLVNVFVINSIFSDSVTVTILIKNKLRYRTNKQRKNNRYETGVLLKIRERS